MDLSIAPALLFTPGNKPERFAKGLNSGANGLILDLEDAVPEAEKEQARDNVLQFLNGETPDSVYTIIRINHIKTNAGLRDLLALKDADYHCDAILYPKTESAEELKIIYELLNLEARNIKLLALIETTKGANQISATVNAAPFLAGLVFGAADYCADAGCELTWESLLFPRYQVVQAAALAKIAAIDSPFFDFANEEKLVSETMEVKALGFKGKLAIHPKQVDAIKRCFTPSAEQVEKARKIIALYEEAGGKACQYQGEMIDVPVYRHAQQLVQLFKSIRGE
ncbi:Malyl-CoA lyase [Legionella massiliensis]|uniref:Malyl-CoA lyase n=1 Tax=Legionella massiliensis TaxID=1034943 RepID=A0A078L0J3_9GAMM|nr:aldolase/citrate lyase family protein [Legionella massiliensis]CDZ77523.1 Malyl-CoA lyase [Legionella massiliensis]CEE13261.1 Malyl-CoA lyase [Legionella massiliensis]